MIQPAHDRHWCFLGTFGTYERGAMPACEGRAIRAHQIPKSVIRKELWRRDTNDELDAIVWDERVWIWACGGITGSDGHHGMFDQERTLRVPALALPIGLVEYATQYGLTYRLARDFGIDVWRRAELVG